MYQAAGLFGVLAKISSDRDRAMLEQMVAAIDVTRMKPVIDKVFPFEEAIAAYKYHAAGAFMGKVVSRL